jgi:hypothetical protein
MRGCPPDVGKADSTLEFRRMLPHANKRNCSRPLRRTCRERRPCDNVRFVQSGLISPDLGGRSAIGARNSPSHFTSKPHWLAIWPGDKIGLLGGWANALKLVELGRAAFDERPSGVACVLASRGPSVCASFDE